MANIESRVIALENRARARRKVKPIASSLVAFKTSISPQYYLTIPAGQPVTKRIKFAPSNGKTNLTTLSAKSDWTKLFYYQEPQANDGSTVIDVKLYGPLAEDVSVSFSIVALGTCSGTFSEV